MLEQLFPFRHTQYQSGAAAPILEEFAAWLISAAYSRSSTQGHVQRLKRVLGRRRSMPPRWSPVQVKRAFSAVSENLPRRVGTLTFAHCTQCRGQPSRLVTKTMIIICGVTRRPDRPEPQGCGATPHNNVLNLKPGRIRMESSQANWCGAQSVARGRETGNPR